MTPTILASRRMRAPLRHSEQPADLIVQLRKLEILSSAQVEHLTRYGVYDQLLILHRESAIPPPTVVSWLQNGVQRLETALNAVICEDVKFTSRLLEQLTRFAVQHHALHLPFWLVGRCRQALTTCGNLLNRPHALLKSQRHDLRIAADHILSVSAAIAPHCLPSVKSHRWQPRALLEARHPDVALAYANDYGVELVPLGQREVFIDQVIHGMLTAPATAISKIVAKIDGEKQGPLLTRLWLDTYKTALRAVFAQLAHLVIAGDERAQSACLTHRRLLASPAVYCFGGYISTLSTVGHVTYQATGILHDLSPTRAALLADQIAFALGSYSDWLESRVGDDVWLFQNTTVVEAIKPKEMRKTKKALLLQDPSFNDLACYIVVDFLAHHPEFRVTGFQSPNPRIITSELVRAHAAKMLKRLPLPRKQIITRKILEHSPVQVLDYHNTGAVAETIAACESLFNCALGIDPQEGDIE